MTVFSLERLSCGEERNTSPFSRWLVFANLKGQAFLLEGLRLLFFLSPSLTRLSRLARPTLFPLGLGDEVLQNSVLLFGL